MKLAELLGNQRGYLGVAQIRRRERPRVDELLHAAAGEAAEEAWPLAVAGHALEGADLVGAVEEDLDALAVDAHEHLAVVALAAAAAAGPGDPEYLVGHGALELGHGEGAGVDVAAPELAGEAVQDAARILGDAVDAGAPLQGRRGRGGLVRRRVHGDHWRLRCAEEEEAICGGGRVREVSRFVWCCRVGSMRREWDWDWDWDWDFWVGMAAGSDRIGIGEKAEARGKAGRKLPGKINRSHGASSACQVDTWEGGT